MQDLDLADLYAELQPRKHGYHISTMVCYYGQHYMAFVLTPDSMWHMFDDAKVTLVGPWPDVVEKCVLGRIQPSVLFYEKLWSARCHP